MRSARATSLLLAAAAVVVLGVLLAVLLAGGDEDDSRRPAADWPFSSLRQPSGGMPPRLRAGTNEVLVNPRSVRLRFAEAGYATTPTGGLWVVPGKGVVCIFRARTLTSSCAKTADARREGVVLQVYEVGADPTARPTRFTVLGVVPDGVRAVELSSKGPLRTVPVSGNAFSAEAGAPLEVTRLVRVPR